MYEELVKAMRETRERVKSNPGVAMFVPPYQLSEAADAIEKLSKPKWIPVTERLPKDRQRVLVFYWLDVKPKQPRHQVCYFASNLSKVDKYDFDGCNRPGFYNCDSEYGYYELDDVTHWMPLPEPPDHIGEANEMVEKESES